MSINISIALATYNGASFLVEQLDSILNQTIPASEIIICDDCSTDNTWYILCEYAKKNKSIKVVQNKNNIGFIRNFEKAISLCSGDYIALSDQDDIWLSDHLQILLEGIGNKICTVADAELMDSRGCRLGYKLSYCENLDFIPEDDLLKAYFILFYRNPYQGASMMFRKDFLKKALPIPDGVLYHDTWFSALSCFYGGFQPLKSVITFYRRHEKAVTGVKIRKTKLRTLISHFLLGRTNSYRLMIISAIKNRIDNLTEEQTNFLKQADLYYRRQNSIKGRISNLIFDLKHYKIIYGCK